MRISAPFSASSLSTTIWAAATRNLTTIVNNFLTVNSQGVLAASTILDLRPSTGYFRHVFVTDVSAVSTTLFGLYDGAFFRGVQGTNVMPNAFIVGINAFGPAVNNTSGAGVGIYGAGFDMF